MGAGCIVTVGGVSALTVDLTQAILQRETKWFSQGLLAWREGAQASPLTQAIGKGSFPIISLSQALCQWRIEKRGGSGREKGSRSPLIQLVARSLFSIVLTDQSLEQAIVLFFSKHKGFSC